MKYTTCTIKKSFYCRNTIKFYVTNLRKNHIQTVKVESTQTQQQFRTGIILQAENKHEIIEQNKSDFNFKLDQRIQQFAASVVLSCTLVIAPVLNAAAFVPLEARNIEIFHQSKAAVVNVTNFAVRKDAFSLDLEEIPQGMGSGIVWDEEGHIVTNYHVVSGAQDMIVTLTDGNEYKATPIGVDMDKDIAVLSLVLNTDTPQPQNTPTPTHTPQPQIAPTSADGLSHPAAPPKLVQLKQGSSSDLEVGQIVYAIGNPFGLDHTLTTGIISGTGREISSLTGRPIQGVIQTDAAINPGNSGGPLLDSDGKLIGMNTAIYSQTGTSAGVGFAIPVDVMKSSVDQIIKFGKVMRPILGIALAPEQTMEQLRLKGVLVLSLKPDGPADVAGVKGTQRDSNGRLVLGDIIVGINGNKVKKPADLYRVLDSCVVGETIMLEVLRENSRENVQVTLGENA